MNRLGQPSLFASPIRSRAKNPSRWTGRWLFSIFLAVPRTRPLAWDRHAPRARNEAPTAREKKEPRNTYTRDGFNPYAIPRRYSCARAVATTPSHEDAFLQFSACQIETMLRLSEKSFFAVLVGVLVVAALYRLYPLVLGPQALAQAFQTEDGYLMLTIARNMAIGLGMSVSDGTIPSNGVQPLATFIFSVPYLLSGGDKVVGLWGVQLISAVIAFAGIFSVRALARVFLSPQSNSPIWPWLVATLWFASPLLLLHTMNGLETGLYTVMVSLSLTLFARLLDRGAAATVGDRLFLGVVCGITFLARNDAVFLIAAIGLIWLAHALAVQQRAFWPVLAELVAPAVVVALIAAPWLINNYVSFGSIVPVSGTAQSLSGGWAKNADLLPAKLFEYALPMLPVPNGLETRPAFMVFAMIVVALILITFTVQVWRRGGVARYVMAAYLMFSALMIFYYGFLFGAGWFLSRYLSPLAPLLITATVSVTLSLAGRLVPTRAAAATYAMGSLSLVLCLALLGRYLVPGVRDQGHFQVVHWVQENVPEETWIGAVQSGTLGYWHNRTINLDGKVNPAALQAIQTNGDVRDYVVHSRIDYLADWEGIAEWVDDDQGNERFSENFEVVVHDVPANLAVLKRK